MSSTSRARTGVRARQRRSPRSSPDRGGAGDDQTTSRSPAGSATRDGGGTLGRGRRVVIGTAPCGRRHAPGPGRADTERSRRGRPGHPRWRRGRRRLGAGARGEPWPDVLRRSRTPGPDRDRHCHRSGRPARRSDLGLLEEIADQASVPVIASGGIRSIADLQAVRAAGCAGAIVGRALYDGRLDLAAAIAAFSRTERPIGPARIP